MIFLVAYDRREQKLLREVETFDSGRRPEAYRRRLEVQLSLPSDEGRYEVVLLEAASRKIIEETHARYFHDVPTLIRDAKDELDATDRRLQNRKKRRPA